MYELVSLFFVRYDDMHILFSIANVISVIVVYMYCMYELVSFFVPYVVMHILFTVVNYVRICICVLGNC